MTQPTCLYVADLANPGLRLGGASRWNPLLAPPESIYCFTHFYSFTLLLLPLLHSFIPSLIAFSSPLLLRFAEALLKASLRGARRGWDAWRAYVRARVDLRDECPAAAQTRPPQLGARAKPSALAGEPAAIARTSGVALEGHPPPSRRHDPQALERSPAAEKTCEGRRRASAHAGPRQPARARADRVRGLLVRDHEEEVARLVRFRLRGRRPGARFKDASKLIGQYTSACAGNRISWYVRMRGKNASKVYFQRGCGKAWRWGVRSVPVSFAEARMALLMDT